MEYLNATEEFVYIINDWGYFNKTSNQWTGMVRQLMDNDLDVSGMKIFMYKLLDNSSKKIISGVAILFTPTRSQVIQYLAKTTKLEMKFVFRSPKLSFSDNVFLLSFDKVNGQTALPLRIENH